MFYYYKRNYFGGRDLDQSGYLQVIKTQSIFIREQIKDVEKIAFQVYWMIKGEGVIQKMMLQGWPKVTSKTYSLLLIQLI